MTPEETTRYDAYWNDVADNMLTSKINTYRQAILNGAIINKATGNSATVFYTQQGSYVIVDDVTKAIVQISDNINPSTWAPDLSIVDPYIPD